jgi:hypothetical protein
LTLLAGFAGAAMPANQIKSLNKHLHIPRPHRQYAAPSAAILSDKHLYHIAFFYFHADVVPPKFLAGYIRLLQ